MPVTKTAKRALRGSAKKAFINRSIITKLDIAIRKAKSGKTRELILKAISLADIASKKKVLHKNKTARIKSQLSKFLPKSPSKKVKKTKK